MDVEDLFGEIRAQVRGCPADLMSYALIQAARTFAAETWILRRQFVFNAIPTQQQYSIVAPQNERCIAVKHAQLQDVAPGMTINPLRFVYPTLVNPNVGPERPWGICYVPYDTVALVPVPDAAYPVTLEIITEPVLGGDYIPDEMGAKWSRALGYGALEWLFRTNKNDPWFDLQQSAAMLIAFNGEIAKARGEAAFDFTPNQRNLIPFGFARRRR